MRRLITCGLVVVALGALNGNVLAQSPSASAAPSPAPSATPAGTVGSAYLCIMVAGRIPTGGWTPTELAEALTDGTLAVARVMEPADCASTATTPTPRPTPTASPLAATQQLFVNLALKDKSGRPSITGQLGCHGTGGYSDLSKNTQITVKDASGTIVAVGTLGSSLRMGPHECDFIGASITVPGDLDIYQVEVGRRGALSFTRAELEAEKWIVFVTIGS